MPALRPAPRLEDTAASYWLYTAALATPDEARRDALLRGLIERGIEARPIWRPIHATQRYAQAARLGGAAADAIFAAGFCLPSSSSLSEPDQDRVIDALRGVVADAVL
jgi:dTDP-4-amino-4,6-dideoxygalactose transaminase